MRELSISPEAPQIQLDDMEFAFMAGAWHMWVSVWLLIDCDTPDEASDEETSYMDNIKEEITTWVETLKKNDSTIN